MNNKVGTSKPYRSSRSRREDRMRTASDLLGEMIMERVNRKGRQGRLLECDAGITPMKEEGKERALSKKILRLLCNSWKVLAIPVVSPRAKVDH